MIGCVVATTSWGFHVAALALAPISVVQAVIAGGLVLVTVLADRVFGHSVTRREWIGVALTAAGLAFLALTLEGTVDEAHSDYGDVALLVTLVGSTVAALALAARSGERPGARGLRRPAVGAARTSRSRRPATTRTSASACSSTRSRS